jgi:branched-chain amino acid transport system ATP-binding protein
MAKSLTIDAVSKRFGGLQALNNCSFSVEAGAVCCLVGPNGAGKTTVFDVITGFLKPDSGTVRLADTAITGLDRRAVVKRGVARSFQNLRLFDELSVVDNVVVCLADETGNNPLTSIFRPFRSNAIIKRKTSQALALLETVGLSHKADHRVTEISFGQQKLLCIARVLATNADFLLLDEPTSGLSATALEEMVAVIRKLSASGKTLLVVEHNTKIVRDIADKIVFMHQGQVLASDVPNAVLERRDLIDIYFGGG